MNMDLNGIYRDYLIANNSLISKKDEDSISENKIGTVESLSFENMVTEKIDSVNKKQIEADEMTIGMVTGEVDDLHEVMIATEEARLSLELAVQLRNKCIEAFREINNMQL